jgi:hypothetical protein
MESNLRPLTLGEILDRTAQLYRTNFLLFAGIFAVYAGGVLLLNLLQLGMQEMLKAQHLTSALVWESLAAGILEMLFVLPEPSSPPSAAPWLGFTWASQPPFAAPTRAFCLAWAATCG